MKEYENGNILQPIEFKQRLVPNFDNFVISIKLNAPNTVRIRRFNISKTEKLSENREPITSNMSGIEYAYACQNGLILIYRDCSKSELFSGQQHLDTHEFRTGQNGIDKAKIAKIRAAGLSAGKWINIYTSFKQSEDHAARKQVSA